MDAAVGALSKEEEDALLYDNGDDEFVDELDASNGSKCTVTFAAKRVAETVYADEFTPEEEALLLGSSCSSPAASGLKRRNAGTEEDGNGDIAFEENVNPDKLILTLGGLENDDREKESEDNDFVDLDACYDELLDLDEGGGANSGSTARDSTQMHVEISVSDDHINESDKCSSIDNNRNSSDKRKRDADRQNLEPSNAYEIASTKRAKRASDIAEQDFVNGIGGKNNKNLTEAESTSSSMPQSIDKVHERPSSEQTKLQHTSRSITLRRPIVWNNDNTATNRAPQIPIPGSTKQPGAPSKKISVVSCHSMTTSSMPEGNDSTAVSKAELKRMRKKELDAKANTSANASKQQNMKAQIMFPDEQHASSNNTRHQEMLHRPRTVHINPNFRGSVQADPNIVLTWNQTAPSPAAALLSAALNTPRGAINAVLTPPNAMGRSAGDQSFNRVPGNYNVTAGAGRSVSARPLGSSFAHMPKSFIYNPLQQFNRRHNLMQNASYPNNNNYILNGIARRANVFSAPNTLMHSVTNNSLNFASPPAVEASAYYGLQHQQQQAPMLVNSPRGISFNQNYANLMPNVAPAVMTQQLMAMQYQQQQQQQNQLVLNAAVLLGNSSSNIITNFMQRQTSPTKPLTMMPPQIAGNNASTVQPTMQQLQFGTTQPLINNGFMQAYNFMQPNSAQRGTVPFRQPFTRFPP